MNARRRTPLLALGVLLCQAWAAVPVGPQRLLRPSAAFLSHSSSSWRLHHALKGARGTYAHGTWLGLDCTACCEDYEEQLSLTDQTLGEEQHGNRMSNTEHDSSLVCHTRHDPDLASIA